jgi:hypothetical protein
MASLYVLYISSNCLEILLSERLNVIQAKCDNPSHLSATVGQSAERLTTGRTTEGMEFKSQQNGLRALLNIAYLDSEVHRASYQMPV